MKTELFENADVTVSIYCILEHAVGSLGMMRGHFACLFSFIEVRMPNIVIDYRYRISNCECHNVFVWTEIFSKTLFVWTRIFLKRIKKDAFSKISGYV